MIEYFRFPPYNPPNLHAYITMSNFRILPATPAEYETIRQIAHATWPDTFGDILSEAQIDYMLGMMYSLEAVQDQVAKGHVFHLLLEEEAEQLNEGAATRFRPVAYFSHQLDYLPGTTKIHKLYALPSVQGKGYGKAMISKVEAIAKAAGQQTVRLDVNYENKAVGFYEYLGFEKMGRYDTDIGHGYLMEDWIMEKPL
jgi:ribosomal protein S18 acetylase RimI-like enzyme